MLRNVKDASGLLRRVERKETPIIANFVEDLGYGLANQAFKELYLFRIHQVFPREVLGTREAYRHNPIRSMHTLRTLPMESIRTLTRS